MQMMWRPRNFRHSLMPITTLSAIMGFGTFDWPPGRPRVVFSAIYGITVTFIYWVLFIWTLKYSFGSGWFDSEDKIIYMIVYINLAISMITHLLYFLHYQKYERCLLRIVKVDETLSQLGVAFDYTRCMKIAIIMDICWLVMILLQNSIDVLWFAHKIQLPMAITIVSVIHYPTHMNTMVSLHYCLMMSQIGERFRQANKLLEDTFKFNDNLSITNITRGVLKKRVNVVESIDSNDIHYSQSKDTVTSLVQSVKHVHLELTLIAKDVNHIYSVIILLEMAAFFVLFTGSFWILYIIITSSVLEQNNLRIFVIVALIIAYIPIAILINHVSETVSAEAKRTGPVIHCVHNGNDDSTFRDEIRQFTLQLLTNPLEFSPLGFFTLGYDFLRGYFGTVVTYVVILIQLGSDPKIVSQ